MNSKPKYGIFDDQEQIDEAQRYLEQLQKEHPELFLPKENDKSK